MYRLRLGFMLLILLPVVKLSAQQFGEITGTVTDASGAVIAGAQITVKNTATQQVRTATCNDTGVY